MPLYRTDLPQLQSGANSLAQLILGSEHREAEAAQKNKYAVEAAAAKEAAERQALLDNVSQANQFADKNGLKPGKYSMSANQSGFSVNPEPVKDPLELLLKQQMLNRNMEEKDDKAVQQLSKRVEAAKLGPSQVGLENLGRSVQEKGVALGPISGSNWSPAWAVSLAEQAGLADPGATEQKQAVEGLKSFQRSPLYGSALTPGEQQSFETSFGLLTAGTQEQRVQAMKTLEALYNKATANVAAGSAPRIREKYKDQGGISLEPSNVFGTPQTGADPAAEARRRRIAELKAKRGH